MGTDGQNTTTYIYNKYKLLTIKNSVRKLKKNSAKILQKVIQYIDMELTYTQSQSSK